MATSFSEEFLAAFYDDPAAFKRVCAEAHAKGWKRMEAYSPFPVHGLETALGIKRSWIGRPVFAILIFGALAAFLMQVWMLKWDWPVNIGGKPYNSWPAYVVITFEGGILSAAIANMIICLLIACRLVPHPHTRVIARALTDDHFALAVPLEGNPARREMEDFFRANGAVGLTRFVPREPTAPAGEAEEAHHA